jgi:hypothetical protein
MNSAGPAELKNLLKVDALVEEHRNLFCPSYDACLDEAVASAWTSWTCARCPLFAVSAQTDMVPQAALRQPA